MQGTAKHLHPTTCSTESKKLSEEQGQLFHYLVAKLLNLSKWWVDS